MQETIQYLIQFLLGPHVPASVAETIAYCQPSEASSQHKIVIVPSGFFNNETYGSEASLPQMPLKIWEETPLIYGDDIVETIDDKLIIYADLVASAFFLLSRYEEMVRSDVRDMHQRFPGKESLPYRAGFIDRPLVDEYGQILRRLLREQDLELSEPPTRINKIYLTHDVDQMAHYRNVRGMLGGVLRGFKRKKEGSRALKSYFGNLWDDPWYTFPFLFKTDNDLRQKTGTDRCENITFIRSSGAKLKEDKPFPDLLHPDYKTLIRYCKKKNICIGLHTSFEAGIEPALISAEKVKLEKYSAVKIFYNRHHFLNARHPADMKFLKEAGITDDFSLGYADMAGFRLGTCRPVKWINPVDRSVDCSLTLHSLNIMDRTLDDKRYMYMNAHEAYMYCVQLIDIIEQHNGELCMLWHNNSVEKTSTSYHRDLYKQLIEYLSDK
ncbi:MAG: polysaccharide deacetylase family protein [Paludibacteraceae bacterium]|nr:polysaccharide deacetylase family protein [Paludibacteraceae bacterium]